MKELRYHRHSETQPLSGLRRHPPRRQQSGDRYDYLRHALKSYQLQPLLRWTYRFHLWWNSRCGSTRGV